MATALPIAQKACAPTRQNWCTGVMPPMVAWLMALGGWIGNDSYFVIKLVPLFLTAGGVLTLFVLTRSLYGERAAFWTGMVDYTTGTPAADVAKAIQERWDAIQ